MAKPSQETDPRLGALGDRIRRARGERKETGSGGRRHAAAHSAAAAVAWRVFADLLAGILVGFGSGWVADGVFGSRPLFMILLSLLGTAAGIRLALRSARGARLGNGNEEGDDG